MTGSDQDIAGKLAAKTYQELGLDPKTGKLLPAGKSGRIVGNDTYGNRQAKSTQGYKASASWQTASLLRDLGLLFSRDLPSKEFRRRSQLEDALRSMVANIEEGWARPTTKEFLDFLGFSQGSLAEVRGDIERLHSDGLLKSETGIYGNRRENTGSPLTRAGIPTPSRDLPYPPVNSRRKPTGVDGKLREYTCLAGRRAGKEIKAGDLTYEAFAELVNKTDFLLKRQVEGLRQKIQRDEKNRKLKAAGTWAQ